MPYKVWVGNIPNGTAPKDIEDLFTPYGPIIGLQWKTSFCFVDLQKAQMAKKSVEDLNGKDFRGSPLRIDFSKDALRKMGDSSGAGSSSKPLGKIRHGEGAVKIENLPYKVGWQEVKDFFKNRWDVVV